MNPPCSDSAGLTGAASYRRSIHHAPNSKLDPDYSRRSLPVKLESQLLLLSVYKWKHSTGTDAVFFILGSIELLSSEERSVGQGPRCLGVPGSPLCSVTPVPFPNETDERVPDASFQPLSLLGCALPPRYL